MASGNRPRRAYGSGSLIERNGSWHGKWRVGGSQVKRKIGPIRRPGSREGLTRKQAEQGLRRLIEETKVSAPAEALTIAEASERYIRHVAFVRERRPTTVSDYESIVRRHAGPFFGRKPIERITPEDVMSYMAAKRSAGLTSKTVSNHLILLHGVFAHAVRQGWAGSNPVARIERPGQSGTDPDIRYLAPAEVEALIRAVPDDRLGKVERPLYRTAVNAGLRQGELIALRWKDVDWKAGVIRVRRSFTRGRMSPPKSRKGSRAIPVSLGLLAELERHSRWSEYSADDDLVFGHPDTGHPYDPSKLRRRYKDAAAAAGVRPVRFHDLRHTFGTQMAAAGAPLRHLQEWMGHRDYKTTAIYADYAPDATQGARCAEEAFGTGTDSGTNLSESGANSDQPEPLDQAEST